MLNEKKNKIIRETIEKIVAFYGVSLEEVDYVKEEGHYFLRVIINKLEGVSTQDCEQVSRALSKKMDELDIINEHYFLEVSSPGKDDYKGVPNLKQ